MCMVAGFGCGLDHLEIANVGNADKASRINIPQIGKYGGKLTFAASNTNGCFARPSHHLSDSL